MSYSDRQDDYTQAAVASIAAASQTPFKTAFKIYMGIALASIATFAIVVSGFCALVAFGFWMFT